MVSGTISLPSTGFFSFFSRLTCSLSVAKEYLALGGGPPRFTPGFPCPMLLGWLPRVAYSFTYGAITLFGRSFQNVLLDSLYSCAISILHLVAPTTPHTQRIEAYTCIRFGLFPLRSPLLGESIFLSLPEGTKMFQFASFAHISYIFRYVYRTFCAMGCPIRILTDLHLLTASRDFSQSTASFVASWRLNIHHILLVT